MFLRAELKIRMKMLQFDNCKVIGQNFDCGCGFLQDTYNGAASNVALPPQKFTIFYCYEYYLYLPLMVK